MAGVERLLRVVGLRRRARHRVQRDPRGGRAHRRQPALQVHGLRARCPPPRRPGHHPRRDEAEAGPGLLHAVVRRARQGDRRRDGPPPRRRHVPLDGRRPAAPLAPPELGRPRRDDRRRLGGRSPPSPSRVRLPRDVLEAATGASFADLRYFRRRAATFKAGRKKIADRRLADGLHGRPRLRAVGPGGARRRALGVADRPRAATTGSGRPGCSPSTSSGSRRG